MLLANPISIRYTISRNLLTGENIDGWTLLRKLMGKILTDAQVPIHQPYQALVILKGKILTDHYLSLKSINIFPHQQIALYGSTTQSKLGLCDNGRTYISIMHYNIIPITIISR